MALFKISKGNSNALLTSNTSKYAREGSAWFTTDDGKFYIDINGDGSTTQAIIGTNRIPLSAALADKLKHSLTIQLNNGTSNNSDRFIYDGSSTISLNITASSVGAVPVTGGTMTGSLVANAPTYLNDVTYAQGITTTDLLVTGPARFVNDVFANTFTGNLVGNVTGNLSGNATSADKVNHSLTISVNGIAQVNGYDGSITSSVNLTPALLGVLPLTGGTVTGPTSFTTSVNTDDLVAGNLLVNGIANFNGEVTANTFTGNLVGNVTGNISGNATSADKVNHSLTILADGNSTVVNGYDGSVSMNLNITPQLINALDIDGSNKMTGNLVFNLADTDKYVLFKYQNSDDKASWRAGVKGTGLGDANYYVIESTPSNGTTWSTAVRIGEDSHDIALGGNTYPLDSNTYTLGTSSYKWSNVYATTFTGNLSGNATSADKVNNSLIIKLNSGTTEDSNQITYNGSTSKSINITPSSIGSVDVDGDTMLGFLTLHANPTANMHAATKQYVDNAFAVNDAMVYKGAINGNSTFPGTLTPAASAGYTYKVAQAGYINGEPVEIGDLLICNTDNTSAATSSDYSSIKNNWNIIQVNTDGALFKSTNSFTSGAVLLADGTTGKVKTASTAGNSTVPIYLNNGVPTAITSYSGNAATATKLQTARSISLGTAVTSTAQSFDGSANITIPVNSIKEAYLSWGGKSIASGVTPLDMAMYNEFGANRLAYLPADCYIIEKSTDGGATWSDYGASDAQKISLGTLSTAFYTGGTSSNAASNYRLRITVIAKEGKLYTNLTKTLIYLSTSGVTGAKCLVETALNETPDTFTTYDTYDVSGWSGWNSLPTCYTFGGGASQNGRPRKTRFTFYYSGKDSSYQNSQLGVWCIRMFGTPLWGSPSTLASTGHMYTYDVSKNTTFPAQVTATQFNGALKGNADTATKLVSTGTTGQFWRGDNTWSNVLAGSVTLGNATAGSNNSTTIQGKLVINPSYNSLNSFNEGIRINLGSDNWANINFGGTNGSIEGVVGGQWLVGRRGTAGRNGGFGAVGDFTIEEHGSVGQGLTIHKNTKGLSLYTNLSSSEIAFTIKNIGAITANNWSPACAYFVPNAANNANMSFGAGIEAKPYNMGVVQFHYTGSGSTSNYVGFGLHAKDYILRCYGTGNVAIGGDVNNYKLYVNGTTYIQHTGSSNARPIISGTRTAQHLSIGNADFQAYNNDSASTLYLNYYGGQVDIGSVNTATAARGFYGQFDFKSASGFTYSGIGTGSDDAARPVWFSYNGIVGRPVYDNDFKYNPATNVLTVGSITGSAGSVAWENITGKPSTTLATDTGTSTITLAYGGKYKLTAAGSSVIFTMPSADDTNTWRKVQVNGTDILSNAINTNPLNLKAGSNVTITNDNGTVTIASSYTNTDTKVSQSETTTALWRKILLHYNAQSSATDAVTDATNVTYSAKDVAVQPSTGTLYAAILKAGSNITSGGTLSVTGATTLSSSLSVTGATALNGVVSLNNTTDSTNSTTTNSSLIVKGGASVQKQLSAKVIRIDNGQAAKGVNLVFDEINKCLNFVFN